MTQTSLSSQAIDVRAMTSRLTDGCATLRAVTRDLGATISRKISGMSGFNSTTNNSKTLIHFGNRSAKDGISSGPVTTKQRLSKVRMRKLALVNRTNSAPTHMNASTKSDTRDMGHSRIGTYHVVYFVWL